MPVCLLILNLINFRVNIREYLIWITVYCYYDCYLETIEMPREKLTARIRMSTACPRNGNISAKFELDGYTILLGITKGIIFYRVVTFY